MLWIESQENTLWVFWRDALDCLLPERTGFPCLAVSLTGLLASEVTEFCTVAVLSISRSFPSSPERTIFSTTE